MMDSRVRPHHLGWSRVSRALSVAIGLVAIGLTIVVWAVAPDTTVALRLVLPFWVFGIVCITVLVIALVESLRMTKPILPRVLLGRAPAPHLEGVKVLCLLEPSPLFSYGIIVSFYYISEGGFEQLVGIGGVTNIQEDGKIQVVMNHPLPGNDDTLRMIAQGNILALKKLLVKPGGPWAYLNQTLQGG